MTPPPTASAADLRRWDAFLQIARAVGAYLHESQRERGVSALHVESGKRMFANELASQRSRTDARARGATAAFESVGAALLGDVRQAIDRVGAAMRAVAGVRGEIERSATTSARIVEAYSTLNAELLTTIGDGSTRFDSGAVHSLALASLALQHAKEKAGLERARLGAGLVAGELGLPDRLALAELVAARTSYLHVYELSAPVPVAQMLRRALSAPAVVEVRRTEERLIAKSAEPSSGRVDAQKWFEMISRIVELFRDVGDATLNYLPPQAP